jgi:prepilin-type N-terminal cleavage/methylation domain-containing protein
MKPQRGITLIEMMLAITALAVIMAATGLLLNFVLEMNGEARQRTSAVATLGRLAEQFRRDVHEFHGKPVVAADHGLAEFRLPDGNIVKWRIDEREGVVRTEKAPGVADRDDSFRLPKGTTAALDLQPQEAAWIVAMRIESPDTDGPWLAIEALTGRDEQPVAEEEKP